LKQQNQVLLKRNTTTTSPPLLFCLSDFSGVTAGLSSPEKEPKHLGVVGCPLCHPANCQNNNNNNNNGHSSVLAVLNISACRLCAGRYNFKKTVITIHDIIKMHKMQKEQQNHFQ